MVTRSRKTVRFAAVGAAPRYSSRSAAVGGDGAENLPVNGKVVYKGAGGVVRL